MVLHLGRYFWKLFAANAIVMAIVLAASIWTLVSQLDRIREQELTSQLLTQATALKVGVQDRFDLNHTEELSEITSQVASTPDTEIRITLILADGTVLSDSQADAAEMSDHSDRPEIMDALTNGRGESTRWSHTVSKKMKYVAVRVGTADDPKGVVRASIALRSIADRAEPAQRFAMMIAVISVLAAISLALALAYLWSRRIGRITNVARSISSGDLTAHIEEVGRDEVAVLSRALNRMRERLVTHLDTIDRQRRTLDSLLSQLREGVVVADRDGRIVLVNSEAANMLHLTRNNGSPQLLGRLVEQVVPQRKLQDLLRLRVEADYSDPKDLSGGQRDNALDPTRTKTDEIEIKLRGEHGDRFVLARAFRARLPGGRSQDKSGDENEQIGRVLMLTDVTELTRVMQVKADLAANASHELRTPLSAIRASVETLRDIDRNANPMITQFIDVVDRHSGRMQAMLGDLLKLSQLESGAGKLETVTVSVRALMEELRGTFAEAIARKRLKWNSSLPTPDVSFSSRPQLLQLILGNLIDNAIRFTQPGGEISVSVHQNDAVVVFTVSDTGCGIALKDQQRVFERFYQVEQARTGTDRGTGLGLSIVRHAASALDAEIELKSAVGKGTQITVRVPVRLPGARIIKDASNTASR